MKLLRCGRDVPTIFDLLGAKENDMTAALAFVLANSSNFLKSFVSDVTKGACDLVDHGVISIQTSRHAEGITDIEIELGQRFFIIVEAKAGAILPDRSQLALYAPVVARHRAKQSCILTVSNSTEDFARVRLNPPSVNGVPIVHRSWRSLRKLAETSRRGESNANKSLLDRFVKYLGGLLVLMK